MKDEHKKVVIGVVVVCALLVAGLTMWFSQSAPAPEEKKAEHVEIPKVTAAAGKVP
jgi:flagellar basal body-associated protein FliL